MVSRRHLLGALGTAASGLLVGCSGVSPAVTGTVERKKVTVAVPQQTGNPVHTPLALLYYESDENAVHGTYDPGYVDDTIETGDLSVSAETHRVLDDEFESVRYFVNIVPSSGDTPANGLVDRDAFDDLTVGGTASVSTYSGRDGTGHLDVHETEPRSTALSGTAIRQAEIVDQ